MIPELGGGALAVSAVLAAYGSVAAGAGARTGRPALIESAQYAALAVFALITAALLLLAYAFLTFDFSVLYVARQTNLSTPFYYRITAVWGALEGSIVLWSWMLALYTLIIVVRHRSQRDLYPWALAFRAVGLLAVLEMVIFVGIVAVGLVYAWRTGALEWQ
jgi:cytochrome c-type biogenesis protein CcmF